MRTIEIRNMTKGMLIFNLPHDQYCARAGKCACATSEVVQVMTDSDGNRNLKTSLKRIPGSLRIPFDGKIEISAAVLYVAAIRRARDNGSIKIQYQEQAGPVAKAPEQKAEVKAEQSAIDDSEKKAEKKHKKSSQI